MFLTKNAIVLSLFGRGCVLFGLMAGRKLMMLEKIRWRKFWGKFNMQQRRLMDSLGGALKSCIVDRSNTENEKPKSPSKIPMLVTPINHIPKFYQKHNCSNYTLCPQTKATVNYESNNYHKLKNFQKINIRYL